MDKVKRMSVRVFLPLFILFLFVAYCGPLDSWRVGGPTRPPTTPSDPRMCMQSCLQHCAANNREPTVTLDLDVIFFGIHCLLYNMLIPLGFVLMLLLFDERMERLERASDEADVPDLNFAFDEELEQEEGYVSDEN